MSHLNRERSSSMRWFIAIPIQWLLGAAFVILVGT